MKILFLTYDLPYPLNSGGKLRAFGIIKGLAEKHEITLLSYYREETQREFLPDLEKYCSKILLFKRPKPWGLKNILKTGFSRLPFASVTYDLPEVGEALTKELETGQYKAVHFESFYPALWLPFCTPPRCGDERSSPRRCNVEVKTIMGNENVEWRIYQRYVDQQKFWPLKKLMQFDVWKMRRFEESLWKAADYNLVVSEEDRRITETVSGHPAVFVPNAVDVEYYQGLNFLKSSQPTIFYSGNLTYVANAETVSFFLQEIFPLIKKERPEVVFRLVSDACPAWLEPYLGQGVELISQVADRGGRIGKELAESWVAVVPMRVGSGTRFKVLEALAAKVPVVSTGVGVEGLDLVEGEHYLKADEPEAFARRVLDLLADEVARVKIGQAGAQVVAKKYSWEVALAELEKVYENL